MADDRTGELIFQSTAPPGQGEILGPVSEQQPKRKRKRVAVLVNAAAHGTEVPAADDGGTSTTLPRGVIPGYPPKDAPIQPSLEDDELIRRFPNHLHGEVLLRLNDKGWGAKEIVDVAQCPELKANTIGKRIQKAKVMRDGLRLAQPRRKRQRTLDEMEQSMPSPEFRPMQPPVENQESEASRRFRLEQTGIRNIALGMKPDIFTRSNRSTRRTAADDRVIAKRAAEEYRKKVAHRSDD
ncbi:hypothetical protein MMC16_007737 [Acarospora aff. strigata]|nr:hypothetical protein [Acarospora aff. strigata]